jgi:hypothetical protein
MKLFMIFMVFLICLLINYNLTTNVYEGFDNTAGKLFGGMIIGTFIFLGLGWIITSSSYNSTSD